MKLSPIEPGSDIHDFIIEDLATGEIMAQMDMDRRGIKFAYPHQCGYITIDGKCDITDYRGYMGA